MFNKKVLFHTLSITWILVSLFLAAALQDKAKGFVLVNSFLCLLYAMWYFCFKVMPKLFITFHIELNLMESYNQSVNALYKHVGFKKDYFMCPIDDCTDSFWSVDGTTVKYADSMEQFNTDGGYYLDDIYTQRFYKKWVYEGERLTMIFCDPHVDGVKWFRVFSNDKRQP
jgi:hypothetical protein